MRAVPGEGAPFPGFSSLADSGRAGWSGGVREEGVLERLEHCGPPGGGGGTLLQSFPRSTIRRRSCAVSRQTAAAPRGDALVAVSLRQAGRLAAAKKASLARHGAAPEAGGLRSG